MADCQFLTQRQQIQMHSLGLFILSHKLHFRKEHCNLNAEIMLEVRNQRNGI